MTDDDGQKWDSWETRKIKHDKYIDAMREDMDKLSSRKKKELTIIILARNKLIS